MKVAAAESRTFYIEKVGSEYKLVRVYEKGAQMDADTMRFIAQRTYSTNADERILAVQEVSIRRKGDRLEVVGGQKRVEETLKVAEIMLTTPGGGA